MELILLSAHLVEVAGHMAAVVAHSKQVGVGTHGEVEHMPAGAGHSLGAEGRTHEAGDIHTAVVAGSTLCTPRNTVSGEEPELYSACTCGSSK